MATKRHLKIVIGIVLVLGAVMVTFLLTFAITYDRPLQRPPQSKGVVIKGYARETLRANKSEINLASQDKSMESVKSISGSISGRDTGKPEKEHYFVLVIVLTRPKSSEWRQAIRDTWAKDVFKRDQKVRVLYSIGTGNVSKIMLDQLHKEQINYNDLLFLPNVCDSYDNLTLKVLRSFVKAAGSYSFTYLLKIDTDTFIIFDAFLKELQLRTSKKSYYWGFIYKRLHVNSDGKNAEHNWFLSEKYLPFAVGPAYLLSGDLVTRVAANSDALTMYHNEDVSVGVWLSAFDIERRHDERFVLCYWRWTCYTDIITANPVSIDQIYSMQKSYDQKGKVC